MALTEFAGVGIHIKVRDIHKSREFYESLGFKAVFGYGDDEFRASLPSGVGSAPERYRGVTYKLADNSELEIADGHIAVDPEVFGETIGSPKISGMIRVKSILPILEVAQSHIRFPVRKYYWGSVEVALRDPDGFVLIFIAPASDEELAAVREIVSVEVIESGQ
jgi:catechol 2,3-dioxygenase-like lactoylglutathione lyase family enzyme